MIWSDDNDPRLVHSESFRSLTDLGTWLADVVSKLVRFPYETPLGVICALIGAPYFLYATLRARHMA